MEHLQFGTQTINKKKGKKRIYYYLSHFLLFY